MFSVVATFRLPYKFLLFINRILLSYALYSLHLGKMYCGLNIRGAHSKNQASCEPPPQNFTHATSNIVSFTNHFTN